MLDGLPHASGWFHSRSDSTNTRPVMALALFARCPLPEGSVTRHFVKLVDWPRPTIPRGIAATRNHRTRPPPADTRRACCHVLSSFQRTRVARPLASAAKPSKGEPFKLTNPPTVCQGLISPAHASYPAWAPTILRAARLARLASRHPHQTASRLSASVASPAMPCSWHGAWRFLELEGRDARRLPMPWAAVPPPLRARHLAASLTNIRSCDVRVNRDPYLFVRPADNTLSTRGLSASTRSQPANGWARAVRRPS
jgi:hypothetical protein